MSDPQWPAMPQVQWPAQWLGSPLPSEPASQRRQVGGGAPTHLLGALAALVMVGALSAPPVDAQEEDPRLQAMQRQIEELQRQLEELKGQMRDVRELPPPPAPPPPVEAPKVVTSGNENIKLTLSGQINRAINIAGDGDRTKVYFVDNDNSNSRVRFVGSGQVTDDIELGTKIEVAIAPNESTQVSQDNEESGDFFDQRHVEVFGESKRFGRLTLGKGDTASNYTSEVDLSGTEVVAYSGIASMAGGLRFRSDDGDLTDVRVLDAFDNFDGLSRRDRLRYDTPEFYGFSLAGAVISNQRADAAVRWASRLGDFKAAAAGAISDPNTDDVDFRMNGSGSMLHEPSGLNLTVSSGFDRAADGGNPSNFYVKGGWIVSFFDVGSSNVSLDVTRSTNNPTPSDEGWSVGGALVQNVEDFGVQLYSQLRHYDLDRNDDPNVDGITVFTVGSRITF